MKLSELKEICSGEIEIVNDCEFDSLYLVGKEYETTRQYISFLGNIRYIDDFLRYNMNGVICNNEVFKAIKEFYSGGIAISDNPKKTFFEAHSRIGNRSFKSDKTYIHPSARISKTAVIEENGVYIGENVVVDHYAVIKEGTRIGKECIIREGCVVGGPAFYYYGEGDERTLVKSTGTIRIGNNVELHANVIVEKGVMYGETFIDDNTKIDNNVIVGHDSKINKNCTIAGNAILAGGVTLGKNTFLGVAAAVSPNVAIGENCKVSSGAVVTKNINDNEHVSGNFAVSHDMYVKHIKSIIK